MGGYGSGMGIARETMIPLMGNPNGFNQGAMGALSLAGLLQNQSQQRQMFPGELEGQQQRLQMGRYALDQAQQQQQDRSELQRAYMDAQGSPDGFLKNLQDPKYQISVPSRQTTIQGVLSTAQKYAGMTPEQVAQQKVQADATDSFFANVNAAPPQTRSAIWSAGLPLLASKGVDVSRFPQQYPGDQQFPVLMYANRTHKSFLEDADAGKKDLMNVAPGGSVFDPNSGKAVFTAQPKPTEPVPGRDIPFPPAVEAQKERVARLSRPPQQPLSGALANVPPHLVAPATAAATKAGEDYAQAKSISDRMASMMDAARGGNVVSYKIIPEEGALQITTSQGVHRINMTEIEQYGGGGSLWQRMLGKFGKTTSGQSIPASVLNDMASIQDIVAKGSRSKYVNSLKTINQNYGSNFQPVEMEGLTGGGGAAGGQLSSAAQKFIAKYK